MQDDFIKNRKKAAISRNLFSRIYAGGTMKKMKLSDLLIIDYQMNIKQKIRNLFGRLVYYFNTL